MYPTAVRGEGKQEISHCQQVPPLFRSITEQIRAENVNQLKKQIPEPKKKKVFPREMGKL